MFFRLEKTEKGVALSVVDEKGILVDVDSRYYEPEESQLIRSIDHIQRERQFRIIWEETDKSVNLCDHPYLCHQLVRCRLRRGGSCRDAFRMFRLGGKRHLSGAADWWQLQLSVGVRRTILRRYA